MQSRVRVAARLRVFLFSLPHLRAVRGAHLCARCQLRQSLPCSRARDSPEEPSAENPRAKATIRVARRACARSPLILARCANLCTSWSRTYRCLGSHGRALPNSTPSESATSRSRDDTYVKKNSIFSKGVSGLPGDLLSARHVSLSTFSAACGVLAARDRVYESIIGCARGSTRARVLTDRGTQRGYRRAVGATATLGSAAHGTTAGARLRCAAPRSQYTVPLTRMPQKRYL